MRKEVHKFTNSGDKMALDALVDLLEDAKLMESIGRKALKPDHAFIKKHHQRVRALNYAMNMISAHLHESKLSASKFAEVE